MARVKSAASRSSANRCANGCFASPLMPKTFADLDTIDWSDSLKEMQRNWIGRSEGAEVEFGIQPKGGITVFTTRPDTLFGATYMVLSPEHKLVPQITTTEQKRVEDYKAYASRKSDSSAPNLPKKTGVFTGALRHQSRQRRKIPYLIADYVSRPAWHRSDYGRARARHPRLRVRHEI